MPDQLITPTSGRRRGVRRAAVMVAGLLAAAMLTSVSAAEAAPPPNDTPATATLVDGLPFTDSVDTTEATTDAGMGRFRFHAIWYHLRLPNDAMVYLYLDGSDFEPQGLRLFHAEETTDPPDEWTPVRFDEGDIAAPAATTLEVAAGEDYLVMVGTAEDGPGGTAELTVRRPARITYSLAASGRLDRLDGSAVLHGTIRATREATVLLRVGLRQLVRDRVVTAYADKRIQATRETATWRVRLSARRSFKVGPARITGDGLTVYDGPLWAGRHQFARRVVTLR